MPTFRDELNEGPLAVGSPAPPIRGIKWLQGESGPPYMALDGLAAIYCALGEPDEAISFELLALKECDKSPELGDRLRPHFEANLARYQEASAS